MDTNSTSVFPNLNQILTRLDRLHSMSGEVLIFFVCVAVGYFLRKFWSTVPMKIQALAVIGLSAVLNCVMAEGKTGADMPFRVWAVRSLLIGIIIGCFSWAADAVLIKRIEGWMKKKNGEATPENS
jgi:cellobiose-specific phosphotransferase system component IIC